VWGGEGGHGRGGAAPMTSLNKLLICHSERNEVK
jgi:hypothetical protein